MEIATATAPVVDTDSETESDDNDNPLRDWIEKQLQSRCSQPLAVIHHAPDDVPEIPAATSLPSLSNTREHVTAELQDGESVEDATQGDIHSLRHRIEMIDDILQSSSRPCSPELQPIETLDLGSSTCKALELASYIIKLSFSMYSAVRREDADELEDQRVELDNVLKIFDDVTCRTSI